MYADIRGTNPVKTRTHVACSSRRCHVTYNPGGMTFEFVIHLYLKYSEPCLFYSPTSSVGKSLWHVSSCSFSSWSFFKVRLCVLQIFLQMRKCHILLRQLANEVRLKKERGENQKIVDEELS